ALAYAAVLWRRDERVVFLLAAAALAAFMGKGFHAPAGGAYLWAAEHVPVFRNLRDPNRWLIVAALAYAVLAPVTLLALGRRLPRAMRGAGLALALAALLAPNSPTLLAGFAVWRPAGGEAELLAREAAGPASAPVATIPYDQTRRFLRDGAYRGWEHDLGAQSVAFTGRAALGDGSWNQRVADYVAYTGTLLAGGDRAFGPLVGALGVRDLVAFDERPTAPHLVRAGDPLYQQHAAARMPGLRPAGRTSGGAAYGLPAAGTVSFRPNVAVVLGGLSGLSAMAHLHGLHLDRWAALGASDLLAERGLGGLLAELRRADMVVVADERPEDLGVIATPALGRAGGMTSDPALDLETQTVPSDATARLGALAAPGAAPAASGVRTVSASFAVGRARPVELWLRVRSLPAPARLSVAVDGRLAGTVLPLSPAAAGLRWVRVAGLSLAPGPHTLAVRAARSEFGAAYELAEARVVDAAARRRTAAAIASALSAARGRAVYALDLGDAQKYVAGTGFARASDALAPDLRRFFRALEPRRVSLTPTRGERGAPALNVSLYPGRERYTVLEHLFARPQDWRGRGYLALRYRGSGDGAAYRVIADFTGDHRGSASFPLVDDAAGWHTRLLSLRSGSPRDARSPWRHVVSLRLATDSKDSPGSLDLERLAVSPVVTGLTIPYTVPGLSRAALIGADDARGRSVRVRTRRAGETVRVRAPTAHTRGLRVFIGPRRLAERPAPRVRFTRDSQTRYRFAVDAPQRGYLVLGQGYDARWRTGGAGAVPVLGTINGFALGAGPHRGIIAFAGQSSAVTGAALSLAAWLALLVLIGWLRVRGGRAGRRAAA
ncbi:MAG TPA: hypothetical protein VGJ32_07215, partial [Solirubrobacteraceae bacterium]